MRHPAMTDAGEILKQASQQLGSPLSEHARQGRGIDLLVAIVDARLGVVEVTDRGGAFFNADSHGGAPSSFTEITGGIEVPLGALPVLVQAGEHTVICMVPDKLVRSWGPS